MSSIANPPGPDPKKLTALTLAAGLHRAAFRGDGADFNKPLRQRTGESNHGTHNHFTEGSHPDSLLS
jgi:hypothetical protein